MDNDNTVMCDAVWPITRDVVHKFVGSYISNELMVAIDDVQCRHVIPEETTFDPALFVYEALRFGGNHLAPNAQNIQASLWNVNICVGKKKKLFFFRFFFSRESMRETREGMREHERARERQERAESFLWGC